MYETILKSTVLMTKSDYNYLKATDSELREIIDSELRAAEGITGSGLSEEMAKAKHEGIAKGCKEILAERELERERANRVDGDEDLLVQNLRAVEEERKQKSLSKLSAAVSPEGRAVAAVLANESGKTREEIAALCGESANADFDSLLAQLVKAGVLVTFEGTYYLKTAVYDTLIPDVTPYMPQDVFGMYGTKANIAEKILQHIKYLHSIMVSETAVKSDKFLKLIDNYDYSVFGITDAEFEGLKQNSFMIMGALMSGLSLGVFMKAFNDSNEEYYYPRLVAEEPNKATSDMVALIRTSTKYD